MRLRFTKENMFTASGFVLDSFATDQSDFVAVAPTDFNAAFLTDFRAKRQAIKGAVGGVLRQGATAPVTVRLYENLDKVKPMLDRLDIRLGLLTAKDLTVPVKTFGLKPLRERINVRDAEAVSRGLTVLRQAIADNLTVLKTKGYTDAELASLTALHTAIDTDNGLQNVSLNASTGATVTEDTAYKALDALLAKVLRTGRLLYKTNKPKRRQYEVTAILKRLEAGERPKEN